MALSVVQGAVADAVSSGGVGGGLGSHSPKPSDYLPSDVNLAPLINMFDKFVAAGGPNNMHSFIASFFDSDSSDSSSCDRRGLSPGAEKRARKDYDHLVSQVKKMATSAGEPLLFQVIVLLLSNVHSTFFFSERRSRGWRCHGLGWR